MKLWLLRPIKGVTGPWDPWYDKSFGFVCRALSEQEARQYAADDSGDEGAEAWLDSTLSTCEELSADGELGVVMQDFKAA